MEESQPSWAWRPGQTTLLTLLPLLTFLCPCVLKRAVDQETGRDSDPGYYYYDKLCFVQVTYLSPSSPIHEMGITIPPRILSLTFLRLKCNSKPRRAPGMQSATVSPRLLVGSRGQPSGKAVLGPGAAESARGPWPRQHRNDSQDSHAGGNYVSITSCQPPPFPFPQ